LKPSMMFEMKDAAGELLFNQIQLRMVCEDCKLGPNPADCTHMKHLLPKWKSGGKQGKIIHFFMSVIIIHTNRRAFFIFKIWFG
jgi:hypothetical protein